MTTKKQLSIQEDYTIFLAKINAETVSGRALDFTHTRFTGFHSKIK